jgi:hypothetical protein
MIKVSRGNAAVGLGLLVVGALGFGAGALLQGPTSLSYLSQMGTILVAAIPALAAYVRTGKIKSETAEIRSSVEQVQAQTNGTTSTLVDVTGRAVDALAAIAANPEARQRAAGLLRMIEDALPDQPHPEPGALPATSTVTPNQ